ncbi:suppressor of tub2 mutation, partial [Ascosphaera pollenicola]
MTPHFEGRETEQNWLPREKSVMLLRRILRGNAPLDFSTSFVANIKALLDGILKVVNSLRTTVSTVGCLFVQDLAQTLGPAIDPWVEMLMQNMLKVCGALKKITSQNGNATVNAIVGNASYSSRILQHMWFAVTDKNVQPRLYVTNWLRTIMNTHAQAHRGLMEHNGGVDMLEKCIKKGLGDANPGVREAMRGTYWLFWKFWRDRAGEIMEGLDAKSQKLLEKDSNNPNIEHAAPATGGRPLKSAASARNTPSRPSLKETIAAQKRARLQAQKAAANTNNSTVNTGGSRPESALSNHSSNTRGTASTIASNSTGQSVPASAPAPTSSAKPTRPGQVRGNTVAATGMMTGTLSSAPLRPGARSKQQQQHSRPVTADLYDARNEQNGRSRGPSPSPSTQGQGQYPSSTRQGITPARKPREYVVSVGKQENVAPPTAAAAAAATAGETRPTNKPRRLDISALKAEGRQALVVAHAGNTRSPTVVMSPAPDDDVFMDGTGGVEMEREGSIIVPPAPLPPAPAELEREREKRRDEEGDVEMDDGVDAQREREEAINIPLPESSILSPAEPQEHQHGHDHGVETAQEPEDLHHHHHHHREPELQSPGTPRSPGGSVLMSMRGGTTTPPHRTSPQSQHHQLQHRSSRIPLSPRAIAGFSPAGVASRNPQPQPQPQYDDPVSPSPVRSHTGSRSGSGSSRSGVGMPVGASAGRPPLRSRGHITRQGIHAGQVPASASPRSMDASKRLTAVVSGVEGPEEVDDDADRMITSPSPKTRTGGADHTEHEQVSTPSPHHRRSQEDDAGARYVGIPRQASGQLQGVMRTPPPMGVARGSPFGQQRRQVSGNNIIVPQDQSQGQHQQIARSPIEKRRSMQQIYGQGQGQGQVKSPLGPSPLPLLNKKSRSKVLSVSNTEREARPEFRYEESDRDRQARDELKGRIRTLSPSSRDPQRAMKMMQSAMNKIAQGQDGVDLLSFRKLQSMIIYHDEDIFADEVFFDGFLTAICGALERPLPNAQDDSLFAMMSQAEQKKKSDKAQDMKKQYLNTIKVLSTMQPVFFAKRHVRVMSALVHVATLFEARDHIVSTIEAAMERIVERCDEVGVLDGVLDIVDREMSREEEQREENGTGNGNGNGLVHVHVEGSQGVRT